MHSRIFHITRNKDFDIFDNIIDYDIAGNELLGDRIDSIEEIPKELWEKPNGKFGSTPEVKDLIEYLNRRANIHIEYSESDFSFTLNADALKALKKYFDENEHDINDKYGFLFIDENREPNTEYEWLIGILKEKKEVTLYIHQIFDYHY